MALLEAGKAAVTEWQQRFQPGKEFRDCVDCPEMVVVPAGSFLMGSPPAEQGRPGDEGPQHRVTIRQPFAVGKYEVTFAEWDACARLGGCNFYQPDDNDWGRDRRPVINVSWSDAKAYVAYLSSRTGKAYRLLSEAEWEYAARAGTTTPFNTGTTISTDQANYDGDFVYGSGRKGVDRNQTVEVGTFPANAWGLHDMDGNVWEWVADCWSYSYEGAPNDGAARESGDCTRRVLRGGSWDLNPRSLRSASHVRDLADHRYYSIGFRVARTLSRGESARP